MRVCVRIFGTPLEVCGKSPGFVAVVILSLALGIAANSTMFSVINAELYRPLPYDHPDRLMVIWETEQGQPNSEQGPPMAFLATAVSKIRKRADSSW